MVGGLPKMSTREFVEACERSSGLIPVSTAAFLTGLHRNRVYQLLEEGTLHPYRYAGGVYISLRELARFDHCRGIRRRSPAPPRQGRAGSAP